MYWKIKHFLALLPLTVALASVSACGVDLNEAPYAAGDDAAAECPAADRSRIRILEAAHTSDLEPPNKPSVPQTVSLNRPDPADATKVVAFANLQFNGTASVTLCPGLKKITVKSQVLNGDQIEPIDIGGTFDFDIAPMNRYSLVVTGNISPGADEDPIQLLVIDETAIPEAVGDESNIILVNAITDSPPTLSVDTDGVDGPEVVALPKYGTSELVPVKPNAATITLLDGATTAASFSIAGFPKGDNLIAILYDKLAPPEDEDSTQTTQARLFLTGADPLVGNAPGNGIKISAN